MTPADLTRIEVQAKLLLPHAKTDACDGCDIYDDGDTHAPYPSPMASQDVARGALELAAEVTRLRALAEELLRELAGFDEPLSGLGCSDGMAQRLAAALSRIRGVEVTRDEARAWWEER